MVRTRWGATVVVALALALAACGKKEVPPPSAEQTKADKAAAAKAARDNPVYGSQLKAMDKAAEVSRAAADDAARRTAEAEKKAAGE